MFRRRSATTFPAVVLCAITSRWATGVAGSSGASPPSWAAPNGGVLTRLNLVRGGSVRTRFRRPTRRSDQCNGLKSARWASPAFSRAAARPESRLRPCGTLGTRAYPSWVSRSYVPPATDLFDIPCTWPVGGRRMRPSPAISAVSRVGSSVVDDQRDLHYSCLRHSLGSTYKEIPR